MGGSSLDSWQCFIKALEIDDKHADTWHDLGGEGGGSLNGQQYTEQQCYSKAVEIDDKHVFAWTSLGLLGGGNVVR